MLNRTISAVIVASLLSGATILAQNESRLQLTGSNGNRTIIEPAALTTTRTITVPDVSGTFFIVPSTGGGGTANQLTRFGTTTGTLLDGSLSDNGTGTLSRGGSLTLSVTSLNVTGQTTLNSGTGGSYSLPTTRGRNYDALTSNGAGTASFNPVPPVGTVSMYAGATAPSGYLLCDGTAYNQVDYPDLYAIIGTTYGDNGAGTFRVPDMRGRSAVGAGSGVGLTSRTLGATGGAETHTLIIAEMPSHSHTINDPGHTHTYQQPTTTGVDTPGSIDNSANEIDVNTFPTANTGSSTTGITVNNTGGGGSHPIMDPFTVVNFIIKY